MNPDKSIVEKPNRLLKVLGWLSGIVVAFLGTYITGVLTAIVPAPKEALCKLSLGFCPAPEIIAFSAVDIEKIVDRDGVGGAIAGNQIGMLHNEVVDNKQRSNMIKYRISVASAGSYKLRILYSSNESRPLSVHVNDTVVTNDALRETTGGWNNENRCWSLPYVVSLKEGDNFIMLRRPSVFPHLVKLQLVQIYTQQQTTGNNSMVHEDKCLESTA